MVEIVSDFFAITAYGDMVPTDLSELIPYILQVVVGVCLVSGVFRVIGKIVEIFMSFRRW